MARRPVAPHRSPEIQGMLSTDPEENEFGSIPDIPDQLKPLLAGDWLVSALVVAPGLPPFIKGGQRMGQCHVALTVPQLTL